MIECKWLENGFGDALLIRVEVFCEEQGYTLEEEIDGLDVAAYHMVIYKDSVPAATGRMYPEEDGMRMGRLAVSRTWRGIGLGRLVMEQMEQKAAAMGFAAAVLSAQCRAAAFYERLGYIQEGEVYMDGHVPHIRMRKTLWSGEDAPADQVSEQLPP